MEQSVLTELVVPTALFTIMVGIGLSLTAEDFRNVVRSRKAIVVGLIGQMVALPILGYLIVFAFGLEPAFAMGLMILALCPGGALSNAIAHLSRAEVALSVALTAISSLVTPLTIPLAYGWVSFSLTGEAGTFALPIGRTMGQLLLISAVPIALGMAVRKCFAAFAARTGQPVKILSVVFFLMVIGGVIRQNWDVLPVGIQTIGPAALAMNLSALTLGVIGARLACLEKKQAVTIGIEMGMQNAATATFITATLLEDLEMAIAPAIYATIMVPAALLLGIGASRIPGRAQQPPLQTRT